MRCPRASCSAKKLMWRSACVFAMSSSSSWSSAPSARLRFAARSRRVARRAARSAARPRSARAASDAAAASSSLRTFSRASKLYTYEGESERRQGCLRRALRLKETARGRADAHASSSAAGCCCAGHSVDASARKRRSEHTRSARAEAQWRFAARGGHAQAAVAAAALAHGRNGRRRASALSCSSRYCFRGRFRLASLVFAERV